MPNAFTWHVPPSVDRILRLYWGYIGMMEKGMETT